jgi:hypothetical protein
MFAKRKPAAESAPEQTAADASVAANEESVNYANTNDFDQAGNDDENHFFGAYDNLDTNDADNNFFGSMAGAYDDIDHGQEIAAVADGMVGKSRELILEACVIKRAHYVSPHDQNDGVPNNSGKGVTSDTAQSDGRNIREVSAVKPRVVTFADEIAEAAKPAQGRFDQASLAANVAMNPIAQGTGAFGIRADGKTGYSSPYQTATTCSVTPNQNMLPPSGRFVQNPAVVTPAAASGTAATFLEGTETPPEENARARLQMLQPQPQRTGIYRDASLASTLPSDYDETTIETNSPSAKSPPDSESTEDSALAFHETHRQVAAYLRATEDAGIRFAQAYTDNMVRLDMHIAEMQEDEAETLDFMDRISALNARLRESLAKE